MPKQLTIKNRIKETRLFKSRLIIAILLIAILSLLLISRLAYLQLFQYKRFTTLSTQNEIGLTPIEPRRGIIYDRNGVILAKNVPVFSLMVEPDKTHNIDQTITAIKKIIPIGNNDITQFKKQLKERRRFEKVPLKLKLSDEEIAKFAVNQYQFPGISVEAKLMRSYPFGAAFSQVLGYVGRINEQELEKVNPANYAATNFIGKVGIEKYYEGMLHGTVGYQKIETDASGKTVRTLDRIPPIKGDDIYLTIDSGLQIAAEKALRKNRGSVVAIEPSTGQVLALVSEPGYDPNLFINGISQKDYNTLRHDPAHPLYNRALRGLYPPASTIKPFFALKILDTKTATASYQIFDPGYYKVPHTQHIIRDWKWRQGGHGWINLTGAIIQSCDTYFYTLANKLGINEMDDVLKDFGFGQSTGIDMGEELGGTIPTPEWKEKYRGDRWHPIDSILTIIGQGYMQVSPLQLAYATATLANRGIRYQPILQYSVKNPDGQLVYAQPKLALPVILKNPHNWDIVIDAMEKVITQGTGFRFGRPHYSVAAKTGTAQVYSKHHQSLDETDSTENVPYRLRNNFLFIAFAPTTHPKIAIAVVTEHSTAAPIIARKVLDYYLVQEKNQKSKLDGS